MTPARVLQGLLLAIAIAVLAGACTPAERPALRVASHVWPGYELMFMARHEGWLDSKAVELVATGSATESMQLLASGEVDGAALTFDEVLRLQAKGTDLAVVLIFNISSGADMLIGKAGVDSLAALDGKRIGVEDSALGALMLHKALQAAELPHGAITAVPMTIDAQHGAWHDGSIDAVVTYEPLASTLLVAGGELLFDSSQIPDTIYDVLAIRPAALQRRTGRAALRALLGAHFRALDHLRSNPADAGYRLAIRLGGDGPTALRTFRGLHLPDVHTNHRLLAHGAPRLHAVAAELLAVKREIGAIATSAAPVPQISAEYLPPPNGQRTR
ncbi:ABC transporter substrate-binding protein [Pseudothauera lacus]|nr:ABC transporter substrate-binding protein [Pseudothauera lacus]